MLNLRSVTKHHIESPTQHSNKFIQNNLFSLSKKEHFENFLDSRWHYRLNPYVIIQNTPNLVISSFSRM